jgi:lipopolysaccharide assembly outer membrane protein LptD (OstA)
MQLVAKLAILFIPFFPTQSLIAQENLGGDTAITDTIPVPTILSDSLAQDSIKPKKSFLDSKVTYESDISQTLKLSEGKMILKGNAKVRYEKIKLDAEIIDYNFNEKTVFAYGAQDTAGNWYGLPVFEENGQTYEAHEIRYNFESKKGFIKHLSTSLDNQGHIKGVTVKKDTNNVMFIRDGEFCPCEDPDALTTIKVNKIKVIPNNKIITGPGYLRIGKIPTPLAFPFGFFPNKNEQAAGVLIPTYGESDLGFFLVNGGFYTPLGQHADLQITGDIYTRGSYGFKVASNYKKRYGFNGYLRLLQRTIKTGDPDINTNAESKRIGIEWKHSQDPKAKPNSRFSANVNIGSENRFRNTINVSSDNYLASTFNSSINYDKSWAGKPFNLSSSARYSQNTATEISTISLPEISFSVNRFYLPFSFLNPTGQGNKWYERIGVTYNSNFKNTLTTKQKAITMNNMPDLTQQMNNGVRHQSNISTSLKKWHLNINPAISVSEKWYFKQLRNMYNEESQVIESDTAYGFNRFADYSANLSVNTKVFGMFRYKKGPIQAFRHVMTPSVGFSYRPKNFELPSTLDSNGIRRDYNPYQGAIYGGPSTTESGNINLGLQNNFEIKTRGEKERKIKLLDNLNLSSSYDLFKDSLNWSRLAANARTTLFKKINLVYTGQFGLYQKDSLGRDINQLRIKNGQSLGRMENSSFNAGVSFNKDDFKSLFAKQNTEDNKDEKEDKPKKLKSLLFSASANYTLSLRRNYYGNYQDSIVPTKGLSFGGDIGITNLFKIGINSGFDYNTRKLTYTILNVYVDLNCWELTARIIPFGEIKSYSLKLNMKSTLLKDVKLERNRTVQPNVIL